MSDTRLPLPEIREGCPHGCGRLTNSIKMSGELLAQDCHRCGWGTIRAHKVYTTEEARQETLDAARDLLKVVHRSDEHFAIPAIYMTHAERLRRDADAMEARDAKVRRLQHAFARLDALEALGG